MKRTRTERVAFSIWLVIASHGLPVHAEGDAARVEARSHFDRGVALSKERDYEAALREFELAYAAVPHYSVLYNIGQAQVALERGADARLSFQKYLDEGGSAIDSRRRAEVEETLARLPAPVPVPVAPPPAEPVPLSPTPPPDPEHPLIDFGVNTEGYTVDRATPKKRRPSPPPKAPHSSTPRTVAYVLGGASLALGGAALGHYLWNRDRYQDWQADYRDYQRAPSDQQRRDLNDRSESISSASVVSVALAVGAAVTLGTGTVLFVTSRPASNGDTTMLGVQGTF